MFSGDYGKSERQGLRKISKTLIKTLKIKTINGVHKV